MKKWFVGVFVAAVAAVCLMLFLPRGADHGQRVSPAAPWGGIRRPSAVYEPKASPFRHAERPVLPVSVGSGQNDPGTEDADESLDSLEDSDDTLVAEFHETPVPPTLGMNDPALASLEPERGFSEKVWTSLSSSREELIANGSGLLASSDSTERALGGVQLFFAQMLEGEILDAIVSDSDPRVPLTVFDWVRDYGTDDDIAAFRAAFDGCGLSTEDLLALAQESAGTVGGGRSALDLFLSRFDEEDVPVDGLVRLVSSPDASYDVREQAFFKLLEPATRPAAEAALQTFAAGMGPGDGDLLPFLADKLGDLAQVSNADGDEEKIWDSEAAVVFYLTQMEGGLQARDLANYLEYALRRDDPEFPPIIEVGTWEFANDYLLATKDLANDFPSVEIDAFDRLAVSLDRLVEYDPAFNPFETEEDDDDGNSSDEIDDGDGEDDGEDDDIDADEEADDDTDEDEDAEEDEEDDVDIDEDIDTDADEDAH